MVKEAIDFTIQRPALAKTTRPVQHLHPIVWPIVHDDPTIHLDLRLRMRGQVPG
jgi:hypothetical protein